MDHVGVSNPTLLIRIPVQFGRLDVEVLLGDMLRPNDESRVSLEPQPGLREDGFPTNSWLLEDVIKEPVNARVTTCTWTG